MVQPPLNGPLTLNSTTPLPPPPAKHTQSSCYALLMAEGWPSAEEGALMRWAANSSSVAPPKHATRQQYKQATALEALVGVAGHTKHVVLI